MLYALIILIAAVLIYLPNAIWNEQSHGFGWTAVIVASFILAAFLMDALVATIGRALPEKLINKPRPVYSMNEKESAFWKRLGIQKWKDHVPELGGFTSFHKNKVAEPGNNEYIGRFLLEARYGVIIHLWSFPASFLILFLDYRMWTQGSKLFLTIGLPVAVVNAILIVIPAFILRFNIPKLEVIYANNEAKAKEAAERLQGHR